MEEDRALPVVWLFDDMRDERHTYQRVLGRAMQGLAEVRGQEPYPTLDHYLPLLNDPATACVITDHRLQIAGMAAYTGIDLAQYIRRINTKLPLYILTNYADDRDAFLMGEWSVEDIISKDDLKDARGQRTVAARIVRRIDTYRDILDARGAKLQDLITRSVDGELDEADLAELDTLWVQQNAPELARELMAVQRMERLMAAHKELMRQIREERPQGETGDGE